MDTMPHIIEHIDKFVRKAVPRENAYILFLDGHGSRKGIEWIEKARTHNIEVVVLPANTTHFLQPCDNQINKSFQKAVRDTRDELLTLASTNIHAMGFKLKLAVAGHATVTASIVRESFVRTGIWPMDFRFLDRLKTAAFEREHSRAALINRINNAGPASALKSVRKRLSDSDTWCKLKQIFTETSDKSECIKRLRITLADNYSVNSILLGIGRRPVAQCGGETRRVLGYGAPSQCLTVGDLIDQRRQQDKEVNAERVRLEEEKRLKAEERARKKAERAQAKIEREESRRRKREEREAMTRAKLDKMNRSPSFTGNQKAEKSARSTGQSSPSRLQDAAETLMYLGNNDC